MSLNTALDAPYQPDSLPGGKISGTAVVPRGPITAGTWAYTLNGVALTGLAWNITAKGLKDALIAANGIFTAKNLGACSRAALPNAPIELIFFGDLLGMEPVVVIDSAGLTGGTLAEGEIIAPGADYAPWGKANPYGLSDIWNPAATNEVTAASANVRMKPWTLRPSGQALEIEATANNVNAQVTRNTGYANPWRQMVGVAVRNTHATIQNVTLIASAGTATGGTDWQLTFSAAQGPGVLWLNGTNLGTATAATDANAQTILVRANQYEEAGNNFWNSKGVSVLDIDGFLTPHHDLPMILLTLDDGDATQEAMLEAADLASPDIGKNIALFFTQAFNNPGGGGKWTQPQAQTVVARRGQTVACHSNTHVPFFTAVDPGAAGPYPVWALGWNGGQPTGNLTADFGGGNSVVITPTMTVEALEAAFRATGLPIVKVATQHTNQGALSSTTRFRIVFSQAVPEPTLSVSAGTLSQWVFGRGFTEDRMRADFAANRAVNERLFGANYFKAFASPNGSFGDAYHDALVKEGYECNFLAARVNSEELVHHPWAAGPGRFQIPRLSISDSETSLQKCIEKTVDAAMHGMSMVFVGHTYGGGVTAGLNISVSDWAILLQWLAWGNNRFWKVVGLAEFVNHLKQGNGGSFERFDYYGNRVAA